MSEGCPTCGAAVRVVSTGEGTSHYEPVAVSRERALREALEEADRLASVAHDAIWHKSVVGVAGTGFGVLHDNDRPDSAQSAIWQLHEVARAALAVAEAGGQ